MIARTILVVDDDAHIRDLVEKAFSKNGYTVRVASGGEEALSILEQEPIPMMFLDLGLETMNGFELCERIRKHHPEAAICALTGYANLLGRNEILKAGFDDCIAKPFSIETLYQAVKDSFEKLDQLANKSSQKTIERILIIDDDEQFRKMLKKMLEHEGYEVAEACDGDEGLGSHSLQPADLIITDIIMPGKDGIETILDILERDPHTKVIAMSGGGWYGSEIEFDMARTLGAHTIRKPFEREEMLSAIKQLHA